MRIAVVLAALLVSVAGCSTPTGATCPPSDPPTYATFGQPFFAEYCTDCHSASSRSRHGAPSDVNFDTEADIREHAAAIDVTTAGGPNAMNSEMPMMSSTVTHSPSDEERRLLGEFLACEQ
jgi:uncharacterized membrane protein